MKHSSQMIRPQRVDYVVSANRTQLQYIGCFRDASGTGDYVMTGWSRHDSSMTVDMCRQYCQAAGDAYFGIVV